MLQNSTVATAMFMTVKLQYKLKIFSWKQNLNKTNNIPDIKTLSEYITHSSSPPLFYC